VYVAGAMAMSLAWQDPVTAKPLRRMANFSRLVTYDQLGMGHSDRMDLAALPSIDDLADDLEAVITAAGIDAPVLFGTHNGGAVAAIYASRHPVRQLVLCNTWARMEWAPDFLIGFSSQILDRWEERYRDRWATGEVFNIFAPRRGHAPPVKAELDATSRDQLIGLFRINRNYDIRAVLPRISAPTLVLHLEDNFNIPPDHGRFLADAIPNARLVLLPGGDQLFLRNYADSVIDEVEQFVTGSTTPFTDAVRHAIVFSDIVDSTAMAESMGDDRWAAKMAVHNDLLRRLIHSHHGEECKSIGDGFHAAFDVTADAVRYALAAVEAAPSLDLALRAGVHLAVANRMDERDASGVEVNLAKRICDMAGGGQVLVSTVTRDDCEGSGLVFEQRGRKAMKGISGERDLYEAVP
jgi:pimeloyl-ACP methyl ester carboxylesterase